MSAATLSRNTLAQVLTVLSTLKALYASGMSVEQALRTAIERTRQEFGVTYDTVREACTKRLGLDPDDFVELAQRWLQGDSTVLMEILKKRTKDVKLHRVVQQVLDASPVAAGLGFLGLSLQASEDKPGTAPVTVRLNKDQNAHLRAIARREGRDLGHLLERIVDDYIHRKTQEELTEQFNTLNPREQQDLLKALQAEVERKALVKSASKPSTRSKAKTKSTSRRKKPAANKSAASKSGTRTSKTRAKKTAQKKPQTTAKSRTKSAAKGRSGSASGRKR